MRYSTENSWTHIMVADKCLNPGLDDQTANILISLLQCISKAPLLANMTVQLFLWCLVFHGGPRCGRIMVGNVPVTLTHLKAKILLALKMHGLCEANCPDPGFKLIS